MATTWLNLMTIGCCAYAGRANASTMAAAASLVNLMISPVFRIEQARKEAADVILAMEPGALLDLGQGLEPHALSQCIDVSQLPSGDGGIPSMGGPSVPPRPARTGQEMRVQGDRIIHDEHRSLAAVLHGMLHLVHAIRDRGVRPDFNVLER
jgi:hypothetical protein